MRDVRFSHKHRWSDAVFSVGPANFKLDVGDLVFITGGNGSGKSTFLKVLAGLYQPDSGEIYLDGVRVTGEFRSIYRSLIAAVFSDYHLFERLYGLEDPDPVEIDRLLEEFQLTHKIQIVENRFSTLELSAGQRKRVALLVAILEKRPLMILDEWTADQDPGFRQRFYKDLVPMIKLTGTTLVAVTHDDRHLDEMKTQVRKLEMADGQFVDRRGSGAGQ
jgi:putative ATP-binding cassette transporter